MVQNHLQLLILWEAATNQTMQFKRYLPLFVLVAVAALGALALALGRSISWMPCFMGLLFCEFSLLKLFNVPQFAEGFQKYDWIAQKSKPYAHFYPFLEFVLGLAYLSGIWPIFINLVALIVLGIGAFGVIRALKAGLDVRCACMGTVLDVPLSTVTLTEDLGMGIMALVMLFH